MSLELLNTGFRNKISFLGLLFFQSDNGLEKCLHGSNWRVEPTATIHLFWGAQLLLPFLFYSMKFFHCFLIWMNWICIKQYIYIYNVCHFNEIHLEFAKVIFHKHRQKSASLFTLITMKRICYICDMEVICYSPLSWILLIWKPILT